ncbi:T9SS type A sorting domain-containing protein [Flavobacterium paronense]|uniref:T9SS type A sorting domain-containing protein n=1 Tax=Flavobacterium paronense TaxID=1392775 RepID=A0ABV5GG59_9FLAO|nr:T9SS type A sorting domain-containing protein [Flavobacterium paronense]MDN3677005.1 T9SS type A sorting domain-containing protein [Flavobacterium paronense]
MKNLILLASLCCSINCFSQDPQLFQTWYLSSVQSSDLSPLTNVWQITPAITPTLTISNTLNFTGQGACNTFNGVFSSPVSNYWQTTSFSEAGTDCGVLSHNSFEDSYFGFMQSAAYYNIYTNGTGLGLVINNPIFGQAVFQNFPLSTTAFKLEQITLYPNPAKSVLYINTNQVAISKIQIINSLGQNVKTINNDFEVLDIADLTTGVYILKMNTELGTINKKISKE